MRYKLIICVVVVIVLVHIVTGVYLFITPEALRFPYWERLLVATCAISTIVYRWCNYLLKKWDSERLNKFSNDPVN